MTLAAAFTDIAHSIQLAVAPVFLLSGVGVTLSVLTTRLSRIIDRARYLEAAMPGAAESMAAEMSRELVTLSRRARHVQRSIALCTLCALLIASVIIALFASVIFGTNLGPAIALLFIAALCAYVAALVLFLLETRLATASLRFGPGPH
jgi:hypothetical protein